MIIAAHHNLMLLSETYNAVQINVATIQHYRITFIVIIGKVC